MNVVEHSAILLCYTGSNTKLQSLYDLLFFKNGEKNGDITSWEIRS